jgi:hypothetical protein
MRLRSMANHLTSGAALFASISVVCSGQVKTTARTNSASHVAAEMTEGKLNPTDSKAGDTVAVRLKEDLRSNGEVILRKGTTITGVVKNVRRAESKSDWKNEVQSMIEVEWRVPAPQGRAVQGVSFALQSVIQMNHAPEHQQNNPPDDFAFADSGARTSLDARPVRTGGALLQPAGAATATASASGPTAATATPGSSTAAVNGRSNIALLSMPSVVAADQQTSASIETTLGTQTSGQLFKVGHGQLVSAGGSKESVELYSHLSNDTVITSPSNNFEISSGAQMQMLVGVNRK